MAKTIRLLTLLLAIVLSMSLLAACGNNPNDPQDTTDNSSDSGNGTQAPSGSGEGETGESNVEKDMYRPEQLDWGDKDGPYEYVIACPESSVTDLIKRDQFLFYSEELEGDAINTAISDRNSFMEEYFNIAIEQNVNASDSYVTTQSASGLKYADLITLGLSSYNTTVKKGNFMDVNSIDELNLNASYWDSNLQKEFTIGGKLYAIDGDLTSYDEMRTMSVLYNATLYDNYGYKTTYGSVYSLVTEKKWTFETMLEMYQGTSRSNSGAEQASTKTDVWGMLSETIAPYYMFLGSGMKTIRNNNGELSTFFDDDYQATYNILEDIMNKFSKDLEVLNQDDATVLSSGNGCWSEGAEMFKANLALFKCGTVGDATVFRDMQSEFGLLPIPLYSEGQESYHCFAIGTPFYIPLAVKNNQLQMKSCSITEAFCYFSRYMDGESSIYDAFFENMTYVKLCRTQEDREMLTLIINSKQYDLDYACDFTGIYTLIGNLTKSKGDLSSLSSKISSLKSTAPYNLSDYLEALGKIS